MADRPLIMLAEDTDDIRYLLRLMLEIKGYRVVEAKDGQQALDLISEERPDLVFMDLSMPVMDGWEATRRLRENAATHDLPIVGLSAHCVGSWHDEAIEAGCDECIHKPIDDQALDEVLAHFLK